MLNEGLFVWQASGREGGNRIFEIGEWTLCISHSSVTDVRLYDQLYQQTQATAGEVHDEQCLREFYHPTGEAFIFL